MADVRDRILFSGVLVRELAGILRLRGHPLGNTKRPDDPPSPISLAAAIPGLYDRTRYLRGVHTTLHDDSPGATSQARLTPTVVPLKLGNQSHETIKFENPRGPRSTDSSSRTRNSDVNSGVSADRRHRGQLHLWAQNPIGLCSSSRHDEATCTNCREFPSFRAIRVPTHSQTNRVFLKFSRRGCRRKKTLFYP